MKIFFKTDFLGPPPPVPMSTSPVVMSSSEEPMDEFQFPWKQREILTFDIPVHDSERAGLGVSVKGKTSTSKGESIFLILSNSGNDFLLKTRTQEN